MSPNNNNNNNNNNIFFFFFFQAPPGLLDKCKLILPCSSSSSTTSKLRCRETLVGLASAFFLTVAYLFFSSSYSIGFYPSFLPQWPSLLPSLPELDTPPPMAGGYGGVGEPPDAAASSSDVEPQDSAHDRRMIKDVLLKASMPNKTVILTTLNAAWAEKGTMVDLFLESFRSGEGTQALLAHVVIVCLDQRAYDRCLELHAHCIKIRTRGINYAGEQALLSADYIKMIWRRIEFLGEVLEMNYSFVFTDTDVLWFRDPFARLLANPEDFQIACDRYNGRPWDVRNKPNAGFTFVRANERTVRFYKYWYGERKRGPKLADQEVFNLIKMEGVFEKMGMSVRFLDTQYFGGFCASKTSDMKRAVTMHATCCKGLDNKLHDLGMVLEQWKRWRNSSSSSTSSAAAASGHGSPPVVDVDLRFAPPKTCLKSLHT